jgi:hypothetical protein
VTVRCFEPGAEVWLSGLDADRHRVVIVSTGSRFRIWDGGWHKREKYSCNCRGLGEYQGLRL